MDDLDLIKQRINIVDFINETLPLKKAGRNFKALCPFHGEKTPSFVVSPERQIWHCFGCQKGGDLFTYLMEMDRLEFPEALKILADRAGVKLVRRGGESKEAELKEKLKAIHHLALEFYHYLLVKHPIGGRARLYLKERGITDRAVKTFELGFAPNSWDNLIKYLRKKNFSDRDLEIAGLSLRGRSGWYDRFRNRIIFPLKNYRGETIAFSGRVFEKSPSEAKYINSPETPIYTKGGTLYGLNITRDAIKKAGNAVIVEGEFDLISSFQAGVTNVIAIKGSALTEAQVNLLKRFTEKLIMSLDRDTAGDAASRRGIEIADKSGLEVRVVNIPSGKDPDEAARENADLWKTAIKKAVPFYDFLIDSAFSRFGDKEAFAKKKITDEILPVLAKIENSIIQAHYIKLLAEKLNIAEEKVNEALRKVKFLPKYKSVKLEEKPIKTHEEIIESNLLGLVLQAEDIKLALSEVTNEIDPSDFTTLIIKKVFMELIDHIGTEDKLDINVLVKSMPAELVSVVNQAYLTDLIGTKDRDQYFKELKKAVIFAKTGILRRKITTLSAQIARLTDKNTQDELKILKTQLDEATASLKQLS